MCPRVNITFPHKIILLSAIDVTVCPRVNATFSHKIVHLVTLITVHDATFPYKIILSVIEKTVRLILK